MGVNTYFAISVFLFFYDFYLALSYIEKNLFVQVCTVFTHFLLGLVSTFMTITLNSLSDRLLISVH